MGKHKSYRSKEDRCPRFWPDLPLQFLKLVKKNKNLLKNMRCGCILKTWIVAQKKCYAKVKESAWLPQLSDISALDECRRRTQHSHYFSISMPVLRKFEYGYGRRALYDWNETWNGYTRQSESYRRYNLVWKNNSQACPRIDYSKIRPSCNYERCHIYPSMIKDWRYYSIEDWRYYSKIRPWCNNERSLIDLYSSENKPVQLVNGVWVDENHCYALSLQGTLAVIEAIDSQQRITALGKNRAVPSVASRHFREFLVESDGDILLVFLISNKCRTIVDGVEIYTLDRQKLLWIKMTSLGNRTMFVGSNCCLCVTASKAGCRSNCIYFTHRDNVDWWIYDMNSNTVVTDWNDADDDTSAYRIPIVAEDLLSYD